MLFGLPYIQCQQEIAKQLKKLQMVQGRFVGSANLPVSVGKFVLQRCHAHRLSATTIHKSVLVKRAERTYCQRQKTLCYSISDRLRSVLTFFYADFGKEFPSPNFLERSILRLPLSKLCDVPFALLNRALFEGEKRVKMCREKGRKRGGQHRGQKGKRTRENRSVQFRKVNSFCISEMYS